LGWKEKERFTGCTGIRTQEALNISTVEKAAGRRPTMQKRSIGFDPAKQCRTSIQNLYLQGDCLKHEVLG
jgi:hypothetical protein